MTNINVINMKKKKKYNREVCWINSYFENPGIANIGLSHLEGFQIWS